MPAANLDEAFNSRTSLEEYSRANLHFESLNADQFLCQVLGHFKLVLPSADLSMAPHLAMDGYWETWITMCVRGLAEKRKGGVFLCVGSRLGYYALLLAERNREGTTHVVEPNHQFADCIRKSAALNQGRMVVHEVHLSDVGGETIRESVQENLWLRPEVPDASVVTSTTVDILLGGGAVDLLVIGTEGSAWSKILAGSMKSLERSPDPAIVIKLDPENIAALKDGAKDLLNNFKLSKVKFDGGLEPITLDQLTVLKQLTTIVLTRT